MDAGASRHHVEDVGRILLQVQEELKSIRAELTGAGGMKPAEIEAVIARAEGGLRAKAEVVLNGLLNDTVTTLPVAQPGQPQASEAAAAPGAVGGQGQGQGPRAHRAPPRSRVRCSQGFASEGYRTWPVRACRSATDWGSHMPQQW